MSGASRASILAGFAAIYLIWGSTYLAIRIGVTDIPPFLLAGVRFLIGGVAFIWWARHRGATAPTLRDWFTTGTIGVLMAVGGNGLVTWAEQTVPSGLAALLVSMVPFWVVVADWIRPRGYRPRWLVLLGLVLGFGGVALLINPTDTGGGRELDLVGAGAIVLATMLWASGSVYSRYASQPASQALSSGMQMLTGGLVLMLLSTLTGELEGFQWSAISGQAMVAWIYITVLGTVAYGAYLWLLKASTPAKVATYAYVNPVIALFLGYMIAGENVTIWTVGCSVLILTAVLIVVTSKSPRSPSTDGTEYNRGPVSVSTVTATELPGKHCG
jgi:drug/metabolite transporter (DMT)-like permease